MECLRLKEVFKEFIAVSLILILFNVNINIEIEMFQKIFLSTFSKRDSRQEGEINDWFITFQPFKSTIRECNHFFNQILVHGNPA